jgi:hypothetical protein
MSALPQIEPAGATGEAAALLRSATLRSPGGAADRAAQPKTWNAAVIRQASQEIKSQERFPLGSANRTRSRLGEFGITPMAVLTVWKRRVSPRLHIPT